MLELKYLFIFNIKTKNSKFYKQTSTRANSFRRSLFPVSLYTRTQKKMKYLKNKKVLVVYYAHSEITSIFTVNGNFEPQVFSRVRSAVVTSIYIIIID